MREGEGTEGMVVREPAKHNTTGRASLPAMSYLNAMDAARGTGSHARTETIMLMKRCFVCCLLGVDCKAEKCKW